MKNLTFFLSLCIFITCFEHYFEIDDPIYDHQNITYDAQYAPLELTKYHVTAMPFFSPDQSVDTLTYLVQNAEKTIDIMIPGFSSWMGCSIYSPTEVGGCDPWVVRNDEPFPVFQALLNAVHRGVKVRVLTNYYNETCADGKMDLLVFMQLAGIDVRYYTRVSFAHNKFMMVDSRYVAISSINYSYTSLRNNRESGILFTDYQKQIVNYCQKVFDDDFNVGFFRSHQKYSQYAIHIVKNTSHVPVIIPNPKHFLTCNATSPPRKNVTGWMDVTIYVSPDYARAEMMEKGLDNVSGSLIMFLYQITDQGMTDKLIAMKKRGIDLKLLVGNTIFGDADRKIALGMYKQLYENGIGIKMTILDCFHFSHQKFWIIDDTELWLSSGNWSPSDFPEKPDTFPIYGEKGWRKVNRDFNVAIKNNKYVKDVFKDVFQNDYDQGFDWKPK